MIPYAYTGMANICSNLGGVGFGVWFHGDARANCGIGRGFAKLYTAGSFVWVLAAGT
jgi:hypothetical protein